MSGDDVYDRDHDYDHVYERDHEAVKCEMQAVS